MNENHVDYQEEVEEIEENRETEPIFNNNVAELISSALLIASLTLNTEAISPNLEVVAGAFHVLIFLLLKEAWRAKQEGEYTKKDLAKAITRIAAPFLAAGAINNTEAIASTLSNIDQTIGFSKTAVDVIPKMVAGLAAVGIGTAGIIKAGSELVKGYRSLKSALSEKTGQAINYARSFEPQNPIRDLSVPLKKIEFQNPVKSVEWQWPIKFSLPWRKRSENG